MCEIGYSSSSPESVILKIRGNDGFCVKVDLKEYNIFLPCDIRTKDFGEEISPCSLLLEKSTGLLFDGKYREFLYSQNLNGKRIKLFFSKPKLDKNFCNIEDPEIFVLSEL